MSASSDLDSSFVIIIAQQYAPMVHKKLTSATFLGHILFLYDPEFYEKWSQMSVDVGKHLTDYLTKYQLLNQLESATSNLSNLLRKVSYFT